MKPIWIVDDDQSIRFVLEKALLRENLPTRSFTNPRDVLAALDAAGEDDGPADSGQRHPHARWLRSGTAGKGQARSHPGSAGHHHDRVLRPGQRGVRVSGRCLRVPAQTVRSAQGGRADPPRDGRKPARRGGGGAHARRAGNAGPGAGHAGCVSRHWPAESEQRHGDDHRRVGLRQGTGGACAAQAFARARQCGPVCGHQHRGDSQGSAGERTVRPRAWRLHRRADHAPRPFRAGRWRHAVPGRNRRHAV